MKHYENNLIRSTSAASEQNLRSLGMFDQSVHSSISSRQSISSLAKDAKSSYCVLNKKQRFKSHRKKQLDPNKQWWSKLNLAYFDQEPRKINENSTGQTE